MQDFVAGTEAELPQAREYYQYCERRQTNQIHHIFILSGNPRAISPTDDFGLFQVNGRWGPGMASLNPVANAEAAVKISDNGRSWAPWTTAPDCGV